MCGLIFGQDLETQKIKKPKVAFYYSLIPGMGQVYNEKWIKSAVILGLELSAYNSWGNNKTIYDNFESRDYPLKKHRYLEKRNKYAWWIGIIYVYGMIDAVVDSHLHKFYQVMNHSLEVDKKEKE